MSFFEEVSKSYKIGNSKARNQKAIQWMNEVAIPDNVITPEKLIDQDIEKE